ncbi:MAG: flagellar M-ring protein FliF [Acidobacteria bacterium]|nr:flagellar M-ring protein FliF [Acidobacteriota bacterium]MBI3426999.1 flagellar M-ring protein FliF [Acidobacteriota bacterium]
MANPLTQLKEVWQRLTLVQRATLGLAAVATLGLLGALIYFGTESEYGLLFSELKTNDAQAILEKLKTANVPYKLSNGGTAISVPQERVPELRVQMAADGALSGGHVGFDIFDKNSFGATDFAQRVNYQRALEGELARTLEGMDELESARVHITPARESIFTEKAEKAKASVVLRVRRSRELARERALAITHLVASAIEGLEASDVSVMDSQGRVLAAPKRDKAGWADNADEFNSHLEARQRLEANTAARVIALLEPVIGQGRVRAEVSADLDFSQVEQTAEKYDPKSAVIRNQQTSQETRNSKLATNGGIVGVRANDPTTTPATVTAATPTPTPAVATATAPTLQATPAPAPLSGDQRSAANTNYEIDKTVTRTVDGGGRLQRLSVSVVVDNPLVNGKPAPRPEEELKKLQELVAAAVGINTERGDQIAVKNISFDQPAPVNPTFMERYSFLLPNVVKYSSLLLVALLLGFLVLRPAQQAIQKALLPPPEQKLLPPSSEEAALTVAEAITAAETKALAEGTGEPPALPAAGEDHMTANQTSVQEAITVTTPRTVAELEAEIARELDSNVPELKRTQAIKNQLIEMGARDPEMLARTVRGWLEEKKP